MAAAAAADSKRTRPPSPDEMVDVKGDGAHGRGVAGSRGAGG